MTRTFGFDTLERRLLMAVGIRSLDGSGNNLAHLDWGSAGEALLRLAAAEYADGLSTPAGADRPSAREISNTMAAHPEETEMPSGAHLAAFAYLWGQFIDHDLDLTVSASPSEAFNVAVPAGDPQFDVNGTQVIRLSRSAYDVDANGVRQQINSITAFIDGSMIYGSDKARSDALRTFIGGHLKTSDGNMLPFNTEGLANANDAHIVADSQLFVAGDVRANENIELTALHTLFMREHNRLADLIGRGRRMSDEQIFQAARRLVIAEVQSITYNEFLPALLGRNALPRYTGYKSGVNSEVSNEFSTAAFRLGHSMLADDVEFLDDEGGDVRDEIPLAQAFFNPTFVSDNGVDPVLKYLASSNAEEIDPFVVDGVRNFLFGPPGAGGFDLASLNIQRGRDHGLADYNSTRAALGLPKVTSFDQISSDPAIAAKLASLYQSVDEVDLWVGGLAEDHVRGSNLGATFQRIVVDQFTRVRDGDRFWYQRDLNFAERLMIENTSLSDIIKRNTGIENLQENVFVFQVQASGRVFRDLNGNRVLDRRENGLAGITVNLLDDAGLIVDSAVTDRNGVYRLDADGLGDYTVSPVLADGLKLTTAASRLVDANRGGTYSAGNFGVRAVRIVTPTTSTTRNSIFASETIDDGDAIGATLSELA